MGASKRFLVKIATGMKPNNLTLDGAQIAVRSFPLFKSIQASTCVGTAQAMNAEGNTFSWHLVEPLLGVGNSANPWDLCHDMVSQSMGIDGRGAAVFAEPDLAQQWFTGIDIEPVAAVATTCNSENQETGYPKGEPNDWYRDELHANFVNVTQEDPGLGVRIAHLDTGYDPNHASKPKGLNQELARNFVDDRRPNDATDDASGLWNNRGHGTGTLSILAGAQMPAPSTIHGVANAAEVVPIRVANRVELFHSSAIAQAFDYIHALCKSTDTFTDVVSMSMGGLASQAWAEAVNALYDAGVVVVAAAGNNMSNLPTRNIVFPARFNRVIAACGVMADQTPYADLGLGKMAGNYGPPKKMHTALAAYTPNIPWAKYGCPNTVRFNGSGTSASTPQVAATAALYIQAHRSELDKLESPWMRAEAVRQALFASCTQQAGSENKLGRGIVNAKKALEQLVPTRLNREEEDSASFGLIRVVTGLGVMQVSEERQRMLELEALQLSQTPEIEKLLMDPDDLPSLSEPQKYAILHALAEHPRASRFLREAIRSALPAGPSVPNSLARPLVVNEPVEPILPHPARRRYPEPTSRRLHVYAYDPSVGQDQDTFGLNATTVSIRWEQELQPGPVGEYLEVVDLDPASGRCYPPVDLNDPSLLAADGLGPSEANPQFHQQMVYAVAMRTIEQFERALGRRALWAPHFELAPARRGKTPMLTQNYVQRLRIYPHAMRVQNAYYSPAKKALLLGYFTSSPPGDMAGVTGQTVFAALSSDIVAHETTHALLDGLHRRFHEPTNDDVLAFHEAFADIVALFQHFTLEGSLRDQIVRSRGDLSHENLLAKLAVQFGQQTGRRGPLRDAIGVIVDGKWVPKFARQTDYQQATEPHARGSVLVAAVFDAFLQIYKRKAIVPIRLATNGSEVLAPGVLPSELSTALAEVATSVAQHVLRICIRALDYCPPVDLTFGDFLRAIITADKDLVPDDPFGYRIAFATAFRSRGIFPENVRTAAIDTLRWEPPPAQMQNLDMILDDMSLRWDLQTDRRQAWRTSQDNAKKFHKWLTSKKYVSDDELAMLGLIRSVNKAYPVTLSNGKSFQMDLRGIEVHSVRPACRVGPDGQLLSQLVVELTQSLHATDGSDFVLRGGCTLIVDLRTSYVTYMVRKRFNQTARIERQHGIWTSLQATLRATYRESDTEAEPFAALHTVD